MINVNSNKNQEIKQSFVRREVFVCISEVIDRVYLNSEKEEVFGKDIFSYWAVSGFLAHHLKDHGESVIDDMGLWVWGRACHGQAIKLDVVISDICEKLNMLE